MYYILKYINTFFNMKGPLPDIIILGSTNTFLSGKAGSLILKLCLRSYIKLSHFIKTIKSPQTLLF